MSVAKNLSRFPSLESSTSTGMPKYVPVESVNTPKVNPSNNLVNNPIDDVSIIDNYMDNILDSGMDIPRTSEVPLDNFIWQRKRD